jgi:hypothetical protein
VREQAQRQDAGRVRADLVRTGQLPDRHKLADVVDRPRGRRGEMAGDPSKEPELKERPLPQWACVEEPLPNRQVGEGAPVRASRQSGRMGGWRIRSLGRPQSGDHPKCSARASAHQVDSGRSTSSRAG